MARALFKKTTSEKFFYLESIIFIRYTDFNFIKIIVDLRFIRKLNLKKDNFQKDWIL